MARSIKKLFGGRYAVLEDGVQVGEAFAGPGARLRAMAAAENPPLPSRPKSDPDAAYRDRMYRDLAKPINEEMAELRAILAKRRDADEVAIIARLLEPILKAGKQAGRRERMRFILPAKAAA